LTPAVDRITSSTLSTSTSLALSNDPKFPLTDLYKVVETSQPGKQLPSHESRNLSIIRLCSLSAIGSITEPQSDVCLLVVNWVDKISDKGATATIFKVEIAFDMVLRRSSEPILYAVKQFSHANCQLFMQEAGAYNAVAHSGSNAITKCFGTFRDRDAAGHVTHNLLLERGQSDLWDYWMCTSPPRASNDISTSYSRFFDLFKALDTLHQMRQPSKGGLLHGRHGDLKPENILFFRDKKEHTRFKIADFGLAHMRLQQQSRLGEEADSYSVMWGGGTRRYCKGNRSFIHYHSH
jgi:serine/threonine protein kinase